MAQIQVYAADRLETTNGVARASWSTSKGAIRAGPELRKGKVLAVRIQEPSPLRNKPALTRFQPPRLHTVFFLLLGGPNLVLLRLVNPAPPRQGSAAAARHVKATACVTPLLVRQQVVMGVKKDGNA